MRSRFSALRRIMHILPRVGSWRMGSCHDSISGVSVSGLRESSSSDVSRMKWLRRGAARTTISRQAAAALCMAACVCFWGQRGFGQESKPGTSRPVVGWNGSYVVGCWTTIACDVEVPTAGTYVIRVVAPDPEGNRVTYTSTSDLAAGRQIVRGAFRVGLMDPEIEVQIAAAGSETTLWTWKSSSGANSRAVAPLDPSTQLIVTVGNPPGFDWSEGKSGGPTPAASNNRSESHQTAAIGLADVPTVSLAYDSVTLLVIAGRTVVSDSQAAAVRDWVASGGRLLISLPADVAIAKSIVKPFIEWFPITVGDEPVTVSEFGKLEYFTRRNVRIPFRGRMPVPSIKISQGEVLAGSRDEGLLVRAPYGLGEVTVLALDLTQAPLANWTELPVLARRLAEVSPEPAAVAGAPSRTPQLSSTGITDLATQLHAVQENFAGVNRPSPWLAMGLLVALLLVIGPLDYFVVHRVIKRPRGTWITFPIWIGLFTGFSIWLASRWNGDAFAINQLSVVNVDAASATCHQRLWTNVYSPTTGRRNVDVRSTIVGADSADQLSGWEGVPETAFGGMLRQASLRVGNADYSLTDHRTIERLPLMEWTSKSLRTDIHGAATSLVDSDLKSNGFGQLAGTVTHRLPGAIEDWFLVYGNRVYRHKKSRDDAGTIPLAARQVFRVDQPNVFPRELRAFLTGKIATGKQKIGSQAADAANQFVAYDAMSRDSAAILRILTFHDEVGAAKYTGLTNRVMVSQDLSHLVRLGRAVLFGRLNASVANIHVDGAEVLPARDETYVRLILPVSKLGGDIPGALEKLDK